MCGGLEMLNEHDSGVEVLDRGRQFYSKSLLLGAPKAEAAR